MRFAFIIALFLLLPRVAMTADTNGPTATAPKPSSGKSSAGKAAQTAAQLQAALDQLTKSNHDLLDLLKQQQTVLQDMQYDRRQQSRQIQSLEERLSDALQKNALLEKKVATLSAEAAVRPVNPAPTPAPEVATTNAPVTNIAPRVTAPVVETPKQPESYLPPEGSDGPPGTKTWHRLFTLKGLDGRKTDLFAIQGKTWRVLWHNQDPTGKGLKNTSGLFINAFPRDDTVPQRVCGKVGTAGDATILEGPGNYYLQIDASGGSWEVAVEDFH